MFAAYSTARTEYEGCRMNHLPNQHDNAAHVELEPFPPKGYVVIKAVASDGVLVEKTCYREEMDSPETMQFRVDHLWNAIREYQLKTIGRSTPARPRAALRLID